MWLGILLLAVFLSVPIVTIFLYNNLVALQNQVENAFGSLDVFLRKRCDLISNLLAVAKNYAKFEQKTLAEIARLRSSRRRGNS